MLTPYTAFNGAPTAAALIHIAQMPHLTLNAAADAAAFKALPAGKRVAWGQNVTTGLYGQDALQEQPSGQEQSPWETKGTAAVKAIFDAWHSAYVAAGGPPLDFVVLDDETDYSTWSINTPAEVAAIEADPRYIALAAQYGISTVSPGWYSPQWTNAMTSLKNAAIHAALADLGVPFSNFADVLIPASASGQINDYNGWPMLESTIAGTAQSPGFYGMIGQLGNAGRNDGTNPNFATDILATVVYSANMARLCRQSGTSVIPWFAFRSFTCNYPVYLANTLYWEEMVLHVLLGACTTNCFYWNPGATAADDAAMNAALESLSAITYHADSLTPITTTVQPLNSAVLVSSVLCSNGCIVHRASIGTISVTAQKIEVTLPGHTGPTLVPFAAGACGAWVREQITFG